MQPRAPLRTGPQHTATTDDNCTMTISVEPWGGIAIVWADGGLTMLVDVRDAWLAWRGRLVCPVRVGRA